MAGRRIVYGAALLAALAFQIFYDGYLAQFLLVCVIALPILSLLLSLPGLRGLRLRLSVSGPQLLQGQQGQCQVWVENVSPLPISRLTLRFHLQNAFTGAARQERFQAVGLSGGQSRAFPVDCSHCGVLTCQVTRVKALDFLGLFAFPAGAPGPARTVVLPEPAPLEELPELEYILARMGVRPGPGQESEDYEVRGYRPGDPIRSIHWKLSSKYDELVIRERLKSDRPQMTLSFDLFGPPERLDRVLARLWTISLSLTQREIPHEICWLDPDGRSNAEPVTSQAQLLDCMTRILSRRAPEERPQATWEFQGIPDLPRFHITAGEGDMP